MGPSELVKARHEREAAGRFDYVAAAGRRRPGRLRYGRAGHEAQVARKHGSPGRCHNARARPFIMVPTGACLLIRTPSSHAAAWQRRLSPLA